MSNASNSPPSEADLRLFAAAAAAHARVLVRDAELLLDHSSWGTAYSLAVIAFEEIGKALWCLSALFGLPDIREQLSFEGLRQGHIGKLMTAHMSAEALSALRGDHEPTDQEVSDLRRLEELARADNIGKQRGLYVDFRDGAVRQPSDVQEGESRRMVEAVRRLVEQGAPLADARFMDWFADPPPELRPMVENVARLITSAYEREGISAALSAARNEIRKQRADGE